MIVIAHRGNTTGPSELENTNKHIQSALDRGYYVEADVRYIDGNLWLGHDVPKEILNLDLLFDERIYFHCKDVETFMFFDSKLFGATNYFMHDTDILARTSDNKLWVHPKYLYAIQKTKFEKNIAIAVLPEMQSELPVIASETFNDWYGVCTDYCEAYRS